LADPVYDPVILKRKNMTFFMRLFRIDNAVLTYLLLVVGAAGLLGAALMHSRTLEYAIAVPCVIGGLGILLRHFSSAASERQSHWTVFFNSVLFTLLYTALCYFMASSHIHGGLYR
jgi:hypothetical protein